MLGYKFKLPVLYTGISLNTYLLSITNEITSEYASYFDLPAKICPTFIIGTGVELGNYFIRCDYKRNLTKFNQKLNDVYFSADPIILHSVNNIISISVGYSKTR